MNEKNLKMIYWSLKILVGVLLLYSGISKFIVEEWAIRFATWGFSDTFHYVVGIAEITGSILLFIPKTTQYAKMFLAALLVGATGTLIAHQEYNELINPIVYVLFLVALAVMKKNLERQRT